MLYIFLKKNSSSRKAAVQTGREAFGSKEQSFAKNPRIKWAYFSFVYYVLALLV